MIGFFEFIDSFFEHKVEERFSQLYTRILDDEREFTPSLQFYSPYSKFIYNQLKKYNGAEAGVKISLSP